MRHNITVHLMTASLTPGDALSNNFLTLRQLFTEFGCRVMLYADWASPDFPAPVYASNMYRATGQDILWYQFSIGAANLECILTSTDYRVMDFQGVSPAHLFKGYDAYMEQVCLEGEAWLPRLSDQFDMCVVHSDYSRDLLVQAGYRQPIEKLPMVVEARRDQAPDDPRLAQLLSQLNYFLFVGRVVPQKDIVAMLNLLAAVHEHHPEAALIIAGRRDMAAAYQRQIDRAVKELKLERHVLFLGQVNDASTLASLYRYARFTLIVSEWESFCVPVLESMHYGTPVVAHSVPPVPEVMAQGGIVIDKTQPQAAAQAIEPLWHDSPERDRLRAVAQLRAQDFSLNQLRQQLLKLLQKAFPA